MPAISRAIFSPDAKSPHQQHGAADEEQISNKPVTHRTCPDSLTWIAGRQGLGNLIGVGKVKGRWHDHRHTMITDLAESGAGDQTIMDIAGHVSKNMLKHYSHIRMEAKREALESIVKRPTTTKPVPKGSRNSKVA